MPVVMFDRVTNEPLQQSHIDDKMVAYEAVQVLSIKGRKIALVTSLLIMKCG
jgi:DNA-binding LacI/PurR family transcriptional regulator